MTRKEIIEQLKPYFGIKELVCPHAYMKNGDSSWQFLRTELLHTLLLIRRDIIQQPMTVNNGQFSQRGLRCNICQLVREKSLKGIPYLSAHVTGAAIDFDAKTMTADQVRKKIEEFAPILPYPIRLEADVSWVHLDIYDTGGQKVTYFSS